MGSLKIVAYVQLVQVFLFLHSNEAKIIKPASSAELQSALDTAGPGDTVQMLPMVYQGDFVISSNGPATLVGDSNSTIESESLGIHLKGSNWKIKSFWIKGPAQGVVVEGTNNLLEAVVLQKTGQAISVKGEENTIKGCVISEADLGIILEGSKNKMYSNTINIQTPAIIISKDSCCGLLDGNVANGEMKLDGSMYKLNGNVANHGLYVSGCGNMFSNNVANGASFPKECESVDLGGNSYRGLGPGDTDIPNPNQPADTNQGNTHSNNGQAQGQYQGQNFGVQNQGNRYSTNGQSQGQSQGQNVPVQIQGNNPNGAMPKCSCSCAY
jgi:parallel beta-helix repeat protein